MFIKITHPVTIEIEDEEPIYIEFEMIAELKDEAIEIEIKETVMQTWSE